MLNNQIYTSDRKVWRTWLEANFEVATEAWLVFPLKASGEDSISYNDAVEEALCFGWIDSIHKRMDELHQVQRFTPRKKGSPYSQPNIERLIWLDERNLIHPQVRSSVAHLLTTPFRFPDDILAAIRSDAVAWRFFLDFSEPYKRIRVAYIDAARHRPQEFCKRLDSFIDKTRKNQIIVGYGGVSKYYK